MSDEQKIDKTLSIDKHINFIKIELDEIVKKYNQTYMDAVTVQKYNNLTQAYQNLLQIKMLLGK